MSTPQSASAEPAKAEAREDHLNDQRTGWTPTSQPSALPALHFDESKYLAYLDGYELSAAQKSEFLKALWNVLIGFMDLGIRIVPDFNADTLQKIVEPDQSPIVPLGDTQQEQSLQPTRGEANGA